MKKNSGFTLLELMMAIAILAILISMLNPMFTSITKANKKQQDINKLDLNLGKTIDVFKRAIRSSKTLTNPFGGASGVPIYISNITGNKVTGTSGVAMVINVPKIEGNSTVDEKVIFYYNQSKEAIYVNSTTASALFNPPATKLVEDVKNASFRYEENIAIIDMEVQYGDKTKRIKVSAVTRINISF